MQSHSKALLLVFIQHLECSKSNIDIPCFKYDSRLDSLEVHMLHKMGMEGDKAFDSKDASKELGKTYDDNVL